jgi:hypothetical protein
MSNDGARLAALGLPATPVSWLAPQRPVEGTVFVKPAAEQRPAEVGPDQLDDTER